MTQFRSPLIWRLILWFLLLSLIPIGIVLVFVQRDVRDTFIASQLDEVKSRARIISQIIAAEPGKEQENFIRIAAEGDAVVFLLNPDGTYFAHANPTRNGQRANTDFSDEIIRQLLTQENTSIDNSANGSFIGSSRIASNGLTVVIVKNSADSANLLDRLSSSVILRLAFGLALSSLAGGAAILTILNPLVKLAGFADEIGSGKLDAQLQIEEPEGEIAVLANSLRSMAVNIRNSIITLEERVRERTQILERRAVQLQAAADVGKVITSLRDTQKILDQTTQLISQRFGYYHSGIFLLDEFGEYAVLTAANSDGGKRMLARGHRLKVGETGIVGYVTKTGQARIALDVGQDAVYFDNPDLPETHSEMALPLIASGEILGALDVQSKETGAFTEADVATLQVLADQLAVTIQNARLFEQTQAALEAARRAYAEMSREAWQKLLKTEEQIGYIAAQGTLRQVSHQWNEDLIKAVETGDVKINDQERMVSIPVKIRGQAIGAIRLRKPENSAAWTKEEMSLAVAFTEQLSGALESARLYREAQQRAAREALASDISSRITTSPYMENVLRDTVAELGQAIGNVSVSFQLLNAAETDEQDKGAGRGGNGNRGNKTAGAERLKE